MSPVEPHGSKGSGKLTEFSSFVEPAPDNHTTESTEERVSMDAQNEQFGTKMRPPHHRQPSDPTEPERCPECGGNGYVLDPKPGDPLSGGDSKPCPNCNGTGHSSDPGERCRTLDCVFNKGHVGPCSDKDGKQTFNLAGDVR